MFPLRWMQGTAPHWSVILVGVTSDTLRETGGAVGTVWEREPIQKHNLKQKHGF